MKSGIVYAHRNEHVVNYGPGGEQDKEESRVVQGDQLRESYIPCSWKQKQDKASKKENMPASKKGNMPVKMRKKSQYSLLAKFMGMKEVEFSKWLLSAHPAERERVLRDYKQQRNR